MPHPKRRNFPRRGHGMGTEIATSRTELHRTDNIINQIIIEPKVLDVWMSAIADIANTMRPLDGKPHPISIEEDMAHPAHDGSLTVLTRINGNPVEMTVPPELWKWQQTH